jgi:hypothetical protein
MVLAIVVPTALVRSMHAAKRMPEAQPGAYSVQQVLRVFRAQGVTLRRQPVPAKFGYEEFESPNSAISVSVYRTVPSTTNQVYAYSSTPGDRPPPPPRIAARGNLGLIWSRRDDREVRAALALLEYSRVDALRAQPPTYVLHPGRSRTISSRSNDQVECVAGSSDESETPADLDSVSSGSYSNGVATLRFSRPTSATIAFVCS